MEITTITILLEGEDTYLLRHQQSVGGWSFTVAVADGLMSPLAHSQLRALHPAEQCIA